MVPGSLPSSARRDALIATRKKQRPLIRYAGSAAETSIGSKPIGSELSAEFYARRSDCQGIKRRNRSAAAFGQWRRRQPVALPAAHQSGNLRPAVAIAENIGQIRLLTASVAHRPLLNQEFL